MSLKFDHPTDTISSQTTNGDLSLTGNGTGSVVVETNLGIGTNTPLASLHVQGAAPKLRLQDDDNVDSFMSFEDASIGQGVIRKVSKTGACLLDINAQPLSGTSHSAVRFFRETNTTGQVGIAIHVGSNTTGTNGFLGAKNRDSYLALVQGNFGVRTNTFGTSALGALAIGNGTAPTSSPADSIQLYAKDVSSSSELFVRDEAGNQTQLSPHAAGSLEEAFPGADDKTIPLPLVIHHQNDYIGHEEWIHLSKLASIVEQMTGEQITYRRPVEIRDWNEDQQSARNEQQKNIDAWLEEKAKWEAVNSTKYDEEEPKPYETAFLPAWVAERVAAKS